MNKKFRAYYKPDLDTSDGALKFEQKEINGEIYFIYDEDIWYPFQIPFLDADWVVQQYLGFQDDVGVDVYEGDIIQYNFWMNEYDKYEYVHTSEATYENGVVHPRPYTNECEDGFYSEGVDKYLIIGNIMENPKLLDKK